jgi:acetolactate synthase-1/3 small subunit
MTDGSPALEVVDRHHARILSVEEHFTVIQKTGRREATTQLFEELEPYGILEFVRSGRVAISRPMKELKDYLAELKVASAR